MSLSLPPAEMSGPTHPEYGARFRLVRRDSSPTSALYDVEVYLPDSRRVSLQARIDRGGETRIYPDDTGLELARSRALALIARSVAKGVRWPRRITRWKDV